MQGQPIVTVKSYNFCLIFPDQERKKKEWENPELEKAFPCCILMKVRVDVCGCELDRLAVSYA